MAARDQGQASSAVKAEHTAFRLLTKTERTAVEDLMLYRAGFGPQHYGLDFDGRYPEEEKGLRQWATKVPVGSVFLGGPVGPGKTGYLAILLRHAFRAWALNQDSPAELAAYAFPLRMIYITHEDFTKICLDGFKNPEDRIQVHTFEDLCEAPLLLFDDLGAVKGTDYQVGQLESLLEERWRYKLASWFTSNLSQKDLTNKSLYPDWQRITSRLFDIDWMATWELPKKAVDRRKETRNG